MLRLQVVTRREFSAALFDVSSCISQSGGWVNNHQLYSDMMAVVSFEVPADGLASLIALLGQAGLDAEESGSRKPAASGDVRGQLTITFAGASGDLRRHVPEFG